MKPVMFNSKAWMRFVAFLLLLAVIWQNIVWAYPDINSGFAKPRQTDKLQVQTAFSDPKNFHRLIGTLIQEFTESFVELPDRLAIQHIEQALTVLNGWGNTHLKEYYGENVECVPNHDKTEIKVYLKDGAGRPYCLIRYFDTKVGLPERLDGPSWRLVSEQEAGEGPFSEYLSLQVYMPEPQKKAEPRFGRVSEMTDEEKRDEFITKGRRYYMKKGEEYAGFAWRCNIFPHLEHKILSRLRALAQEGPKAEDETDDMYDALKGQLQKARGWIRKENIEIVEEVKAVIGRPLLISALKERQEIKAPLNEPEFEGLHRLINPPATKKSFAIALKEVKNANRLLRFMTIFQEKFYGSLYKFATGPEMRGIPDGVIEEFRKRAFEEARDEFLIENPDLSDSPERWYAQCYQAAFIHRTVVMKGRERVSSPLFETSAALIEMLKLRGRKVDNEFKFILDERGPLKEMFYLKTRGLINNLGRGRKLKSLDELTEDERYDLIECLADDRGLSRADRVKLYNCATLFFGSAKTTEANEESINFEAFRHIREYAYPTETMPVIDDSECLPGGEFFERAWGGYGIRRDDDEGRKDEDYFEGIENIFRNIMEKEELKIDLRVEALDINPMVTVMISESNSKKHIIINRAFISMIAFQLKNQYNRIILRNWQHEIDGELYPNMFSDLVTSEVYSIAIHEIRAHLKRGMEERPAQYERGKGHRAINVAAMLYYWSLRIGDINDDILIDFLATNYWLIGKDRDNAEINRLYYIEAWHEIERQRKMFEKHGKKKRKLICAKPPICPLYSKKWFKLRKVHGLAAAPTGIEAKEEAEVPEKKAPINIQERKKQKKRLQEEAIRAEKRMEKSKKRLQKETIKAEKRRERNMHRLRDQIHCGPEEAIQNWLWGRWEPLNCLSVDAYFNGDLDNTALAKRTGVSGAVIKRWKEEKVCPGPTGIRKIAEAFDHDISFVLAGIEEEAIMNEPTIDIDNRRHCRLLGLKIIVLMCKNDLSMQHFRKFGITSDALYQYKKGDLFPPLKHIRIFASAFGITPPELLGIKGPPRAPGPYPKYPTEEFVHIELKMRDKLGLPSYSEELQKGEYRDIALDNAAKKFGIELPKPKYPTKKLAIAECGRRIGLSRGINRRVLLHGKHRDIELMRAIKKFKIDSKTLAKIKSPSRRKQKGRRPDSRRFANMHGDDKTVFDRFLPQRKPVGSAVEPGKMGGIKGEKYQDFRAPEDIERNLEVMIPLLRHLLMTWAIGAQDRHDPEKDDKLVLILDMPGAQSKKVKDWIEEHIIKPLERIKGNNGDMARGLRNMEIVGRNKIGVIRNRILSRENRLDSGNVAVVTNQSNLHEFADFKNSFITALAFADPDSKEAFDEESYYYPYIEATFFTLLRVLEATAATWQWNKGDARHWYKRIPNAKRLSKDEFDAAYLDGDNPRRIFTLQIIRNIPEATKFDTNHRSRLLEFTKRLIQSV